MGMSWAQITIPTDATSSFLPHSSPSTSPMLGSEKEEPHSCPDPCGAGGWVSSFKAKGRWFDSQSEHMPGLWVQSPVRACAEGN